MKTATIFHQGREKLAAVIEEGKLIDLALAQSLKKGTYQVPGTMLEAAAEGSYFWREIKDVTAWVLEQHVTECLYPWNEVKFQAPIPKPVKNIICAGKNYTEHALEMGSANDIPADPIIFTKAPTTVIGPEENIYPHAGITGEADYEGEIAVIIGKKGRDIKEGEAGNHIFGFTLLNDVTARDLQTRHKQFFLGKSLDTFCPMGPVVVSPDELDGKNIGLKTYVNGELRQQTSTSKMIFSIEKLIEIISRGMTLEPGDIIATGTPAGVGKGFSPARYLCSGDEIVIQGEGIGELRNKVRE
ncbi:fumarylacetoacetate hydrolase family protein [Salibacterium aidingense]|uniref:fumarylacetoacetate hydrolase family protein n=1 Tax=Salibacterium aidingense TaxID=384933 RepID=UPI003BBAD543